MPKTQLKWEILYFHARLPRNHAHVWHKRDELGFINLSKIMDIKDI